MGVDFLRAGNSPYNISRDLIEKWEKAGGTDHPDPTFCF